MHACDLAPTSSVPMHVQPTQSAVGLNSGVAGSNNCLLLLPTSLCRGSKSLVDSGLDFLGFFPEATAFLPASCRPSATVGSEGGESLPGASFLLTGLGCGGAGSGSCCA